MNNILEFYQSRLVRRWHNQPNVPMQTIGDHTFGMCMLLMLVHPNPSRDLYEAVIQHDLAEQISGDFPHTTKKKYSVLCEIDDECRDEFIEKWGLRVPSLSNEDKLWLKFLDQLEAFYYIVSQNPQDKQTREIAQRIYELSNEYMKMLQTFGYLKEADETVH